MLREKLASPVPCPTVTFSDAGFVTVDVLSDSGKSASSSQGRCAIQFPLFALMVGWKHAFFPTNLHDCICTFYRAGLVHIAGGVPGQPLLLDLQSIKYSAVFVEVGEGCPGVHAMVSKVYASDKGVFESICNVVASATDFFEKPFFLVCRWCSTDHLRR